MGKSPHNIRESMKRSDTRRAVDRTVVVALAGLATVLLIVPPELKAGDRAARRPNIIFILADDLGYGDVGCYGQTRIKTPNLDRLAVEGMRFTQCYAGGTVCAPSRCVLMTGLHTGHTRIRGNSPRVPLEPCDFTVAKVLKQAGYTTGIIGKWGLGEPGTCGVPTLQGFDYWIGYLNQTHAHNYYPDYLWKGMQPFWLQANWYNQKGVYSHDLFTQEALAFVERYRDRPFFLYLAYTVPHANNELGRETGNGMEIPSDSPYSTERWPQPQKNHAAMITRLDGDVGKLMVRLKELGLDEHTVVFFSSDNGPHREGGADPKFFQSSGPLRGLKRSLYEGGIRVPMIVRWPGKVAAGAVSDYVWAFWDFLPTAAQIAGVCPPCWTDGVSALPALYGQAAATREPLYWEFHERSFAQAVRYGDWKGVRPDPGTPLELYNLRADPGEQQNIAHLYPDLVCQIDAILCSARTYSGYWPPRGTQPARRPPVAVGPWRARGDRAASQRETRHAD